MKIIYEVQLEGMNNSPEHENSSFLFSSELFDNEITANWMFWNEISKLEGFDLIDRSSEDGTMRKLFSYKDDRGHTFQALVHCMKRELRGYDDLVADKVIG